MSGDLMIKLPLTSKAAFEPLVTVTNGDGETGLPPVLNPTLMSGAGVSSQHDPTLAADPEDFDRLRHSLYETSSAHESSFALLLICADSVSKQPGR